MAAMFSAYMANPDAELMVGSYSEIIRLMALKHSDVCEFHDFMICPVFEKLGIYDLYLKALSSIYVSKRIHKLPRATSRFGVHQLWVVLLH